MSRGRRRSLSHIAIACAASTQLDWTTGLFGFLEMLGTLAARMHVARPVAIVLCVRGPLAIVVTHASVATMTILLPIFSIAVMTSLLLLHDGSVVAVAAVFVIPVAWGRRFVHGVDFVDGAILTTWIGAVAPWPGAVRPVGHAGIDSVMRLMISVLRVRSVVAIQLGFRLHSVVGIACSGGAVVALTAVVATVWQWAMWTLAVVVAACQYVGS